MLTIVILNMARNKVKIKNTSNIKTTLKDKIKSAINNNKDFEYDGKVIICRVCETVINFTEKHGALRITEHVSNKSHIENKRLKKQRQTLLTNGFKNSKIKSKTTEEQLNLVLPLTNTLNGDVLLKLQNSLQKNPDLLKFTDESNEFSHRIRTKYAPLVSVDVERFFSKFKNIVTENRLRFTEESIIMYNCINYNSFLC
jgi:hypothetical protein